MNVRPRHRMAGALVVALLSSAPVAAALAQAERKCDLGAYTIDEDPQGINVRGGPSGQAKVVAVIKVKKDDDVGVSIVAESNGWFRIKEYHHYGTDKDVKLDGWIHGSRLGSGLMIMQGARASEQLREEPSERSKTLSLLQWDPGEDGKLMRLSVELPFGKREIIDYRKIKNAATAVLLACQGDWVKVRVHKYEGWLMRERLCGNPVTTCN